MADEQTKQKKQETDALAEIDRELEATRQAKEAKIAELKKELAKEGAEKRRRYYDLYETGIHLLEKHGYIENAFDKLIANPQSSKETKDICTNAKKAWDAIAKMDKERETAKKKKQEAAERARKAKEVKQALLASSYGLSSDMGK